MDALLVEHVEGNQLKNLGIEGYDESCAPGRRHCPPCPHEPLHERCQRPPYDSRSGPMVSGCKKGRIVLPLSGRFRMIRREGHDEGGRRIAPEKTVALRENHVGPADAAPTAAPSPAGPPPTTSTSVSPASMASLEGILTVGPGDGALRAGIFALLRALPYPAVLIRACFPAQELQHESIRFPGPPPEQRQGLIDLGL